MKIKLPSAGNEKLTNILRNFTNEMKTVPKYDEYFPESRPRFILEEKIRRSEGAKSQLSTLYKDYEKEKSQKLIALQQLKNGHLVKENYSASALRQTAVTEYNSALLLANAKPDNIDKIISEAADQKRNEFVFSLANILLSQKLENAYRYKVETALNKAKEKFGFSKLEKEYNEISGYAEEVLAYDHLLRSDVLEFEKQASLVVKTEDTMKANEPFHAIGIGEISGN